MKQNIFFSGFNIFYTIRSIHNADTVSSDFVHTGPSASAVQYLFIFIYKPVHYLSYIFITLCTSPKLYNTNI